MKALLLAGGRGTRLAPLTDQLPKPMLPIAGVPMIERIMRAIQTHADIQEFVLVVGYRADVVRGYFGDGTRFGWSVRYVEQTVARGVGDAVNLSSAELSDADFMMTYGDIMLQPENYRSVVASYQAAKSANFSAIVSLNWVEDPYLGAAVYVQPDKNIERIVEKPPRGTSSTHWNNAGLFIFSPVIFEHTRVIAPSGRGEYELPDAITSMITAGRAVFGYELTGRWRDVGTREDYDAINLEFKDQT